MISPFTFATISSTVRVCMSGRSAAARFDARLEAKSSNVAAGSAPASQIFEDICSLVSQTASLCYEGIGNSRIDEKLTVLPHVARINYGYDLGYEVCRF